MYPTREELWAGLARELLTSITYRLPPEDREKLWFDLNLRRTDPEVMRRRILKSLVPRSPAGIMLAVLSLAVIVAALVVETSLLWRKQLEPLLAGLLVGFPLVGLLAKVAWTAFHGTVKQVLPPEVLSGPTGASSNGRKGSADARDALYESEAGYLYLIQHDVWRFYLGVESRADQLPADVDGMVVHGRSVARLVQIMLCWPKYLDRLGELRAGRTVLADLLAAADDPESWRVALHQAGMASAEAELASLRELLAGSDPELAELSKRYL